MNEFDSTIFYHMSEKMQTKKKKMNNIEDE